MSLELWATLWPSFPHFGKFANDKRLSAIRLNTAMLMPSELESELAVAEPYLSRLPLYFDIKGRQLRITDVDAKPSHLEIKINHKISVPTPLVILFKAGADRAILDRIEDGDHLIFQGGPQFMVKPGESICVRHPDLQVLGPLFTEFEIKKMEAARKIGFENFFLSYTESQRDIDEFREHVGDSEVIAKIESKAGLEYVANEFKPKDNLRLLAARGDLFVELDKPHEILAALKLIIDKDRNAVAGSRMLLSLVKDSVPEMADLGDMAWMYEIGYRSMMLCDELCLKGELLNRAVNVFDAVRNSYVALRQSQNVMWQDFGVRESDR